MKKISLLVVCALACATSIAQTRYVGGDISMLPQYEQYSSGYKDVNGKKISDLSNVIPIDSGYGTAFSSAQALCMKVAPPDLRGAASTTSFIGLDIGDLLGPVICGALVDLMGCANMFLMMLIPIAFSVILLLAWLPKNMHLVKPGSAD